MPIAGIIPLLLIVLCYWDPNAFYLLIAYFVIWGAYEFGRQRRE